MLSEMLLQFDANLDQWAPMPGAEVAHTFLRQGGALQVRRVRRGTLEALFCVDGQIELELSDARVSTTSPSELLLISDAAEIESVSLPQSNATIYTAALPLELIASCFRNAGGESADRQMQVLVERLDAAGGLLTLHAPEWYASTVSTMNQLSESRRGAYFIIRLLERLWLGTDEYYREAEHANLSPAQVDLVRRVRRYLQDHLEQRITIADLSEQFGISQTYLKDSFRRVSGQPIHHYLQDCRLTKAARLLRTTEQSVLSIAFSVGYSGTSRFNAAFKDRYGVSPREYRQNAVK